jgi:AcrR family transcriptional regulator
MAQKRVIKPPDERRRELIDAARQLFIEQGYEQTAMSDIAKRANVAQGTFYIYFDSKQDVLVAIMRELLQELCAIMGGLAERTDLPPLALLQLAMQECVARVSHESRLVEAIYLKANYSLPAQLLDEYAPMLLPTVAALLERGVREGILHVSHPRIAADFLLSVGYRFFETAVQQQMAQAKVGALKLDSPAFQELQTAFWEFVLHGVGVKGS